MKYFLPALCVCAIFCNQAIARDEGDEFVPPPSLAVTTQPVQDDDLPWKHEGNQSSSRQASNPASSAPVSVSSTAQDIQDTTRSVSNNVQGTVQNLNSINNSVSGLRNGGIAGGGAMGMQGYQRMNQSYGMPAQGQQAMRGNMQRQQRAGYAGQKPHLLDPNAPRTPAQEKAWQQIQAHPEMLKKMSRQQRAGRKMRMRNMAAGSRRGGNGLPVQMLQK
jgi:hypothetical protein